MGNDYKKNLLDLLREYYEEKKSKGCDFNCCNCELGVSVPGYGYGFYCAIEIVEQEICRDIYYKTGEMIS